METYSWCCFRARERDTAVGSVECAATALTNEFGISLAIAIVCRDLRMNECMSRCAFGPVNDIVWLSSPSRSSVGCGVALASLVSWRGSISQVKFACSSWRETVDKLILNSPARLSAGRNRQ